MDWTWDILGTFQVWQINTLSLGYTWTLTSAFYLSYSLVRQMFFSKLRVAYFNKKKKKRVGWGGAVFTSTTVVCSEFILLEVSFHVIECHQSSYLGFIIHQQYSIDHTWWVSSSSRMHTDTAANHGTIWFKPPKNKNKQTKNRSMINRKMQRFPSSKIQMQSALFPITKLTSGW